MITYLTEEDILQMQQYFDAIPNAQATYSEFYPLAKELILRVYRVKDPSDVSLTNLIHCKKEKGCFDSIWLPQFPVSSASLNTVVSHCLLYIPAVITEMSWENALEILQ